MQAADDQGFWYFARSRSREFQVNPRNPAKFAGNLTKYMSAQHIWKLSWLLGLLTCCKRANLPWNFIVTAASKQHPKTTRRSYTNFAKNWEASGKQRCKNPGVPSVNYGNWGWECDSLFIVCAIFVKNAAFCEGLRLIRSSHLQRWRSFSERFGHDNAWTPAKWA